MISTTTLPYATAADRARLFLSQPALPLARMVLFFLRSGMKNAADIIAQFPAPLETAAAVYDEPAATLAFCRDLLAQAPALATADLAITDAQGAPLCGWDAAEALILQEILSRELADINALLCGGRGCVLCCTGPLADMRQQFFEIPLSAVEIDLFQYLSQIDTPATRATAHGDDIAAAHLMTPLLVHRRPGWSLVLPKNCRCPALAGESCAIYPQRPVACRRPQIFPYILENSPAADGRRRQRDAVLAVWDCPYVRELKDEIVSYAEACDLELFFRNNKE